MPPGMADVPELRSSRSELAAASNSRRPSTIARVVARQPDGFFAGRCSSDFSLAPPRSAELLRRPPARPHSPAIGWSLYPRMGTRKPPTRPKLAARTTSPSSYGNAQGERWHLLHLGSTPSWHGVRRIRARIHTQELRGGRPKGFDHGRPNERGSLRYIAARTRALKAHSCALHLDPLSLLFGAGSYFEGVLQASMAGLDQIGPRPAKSALVPSNGHRHEIWKNETEP